MNALDMQQAASIDLVGDLERLLHRCTESGGRLRSGADVVSISEFARSLTSRSGQAFIKSRFTRHEREYCDAHPERFAARWAAKEAVAKAIGSGFRGLKPSQIEIVHQPWGEPTIQAANATPWPNDAHDWEWTISLSHEGDAALAVVFAVAPHHHTSYDPPPARGTHREHAAPI